MAEVTVVITTFNLHKYIERCLRDLEGQTYQDFDILVVDDCSTDDTVSTVQRWMERYPEKIRLILAPENQGLPGKVRNIALDSGAIAGKYLIFLDGDDRLEPTFLEQLYTAAQRCAADIALCAYDRFEEETGHVLCQEMRGLPNMIDLPQEADILAFLNGALWNKMLRAPCIGSIRLPDFKVGEDLAFQLAVYGRCKRIACVDQILIHYQVRGASVISNTPETAIYQFAAELLRLYRLAEDTWMQNTIALAAFIHIGLSMPIRACDNPSIEMDQLLKWISGYFNDNFQWFRGLGCFHLSALRRRGIRGLGIWAAKLCYQVGVFHIFLGVYRWMTKFFRLDIKF